MDEVTKATTNKILRGLALRIANEANAAGGAGVVLISAVLKQHGYNLEQEKVLGMCKYLQDKGLVNLETIGNDSLKIHRVIAHITAKGIDVLEGTETIDGIILES